MASPIIPPTACPPRHRHTTYRAMSLGRDLPCKGTWDSKKAGKEREKRGDPRKSKMEWLGLLDDLRTFKMEVAGLNLNEFIAA